MPPDRHPGRRRPGAGEGRPRAALPPPDASARVRPARHVWTSSRECVSRTLGNDCEAMASAFNASNIPVEAQEANHPIVVERFELIPDSAGAGTHRGGLGVRRDLRFLAEDGKLTNLSERQRFGPYGLLGGKSGALARTVINPGPDARA